MKIAGPDDPQNLLGNGFLRYGGCTVIAGQSGSGKSAFVMTCCAAWTLGCPAFGIVPARKLRILVIQAENDESDMAEMRDGVIKGMNLNCEDANAVRNDVCIVTECSSRGGAFIVGLSRILDERPFDLLIIDPMFAFFGGNIGLQSDVSDFLRNLLNPLLVKYRCGALLVHHMNKPPMNKRMAAKGLDMAYALSGSSEITNWARGILILSAINEDGLYELAAPKRGNKIGWPAEPGHGRLFKKMIRHSKRGFIFWEELSPAEIARIQIEKSGSKDVLSLIPCGEGLPKKVIIAMASDKFGIGGKKAGEILAALVHQGAIRKVAPQGDNKREVCYEAVARVNPEGEEDEDDEEDDETMSDVPGYGPS